MKRTLRQVWCRGYFPAIALAAMWLLSMIWYPGLQFPGRFAVGRLEPVRAVASRGVFVVNWNPKNSSLPRFGHVEWSLGIMVDAAGQPKPGFWASIAPRNPFLWPEFDVELRPGHFKMPIIYLAIAAFAPAIAANHLRPRRAQPGACRGCGYDLQGTSGKTCPECGLGEPLLRK